jgi:hypothetical protein
MSESFLSSSTSSTCDHPAFCLSRLTPTLTRLGATIETSRAIVWLAAPSSACHPTSSSLTQPSIPVSRNSSQARSPVCATLTCQGALAFVVRRFASAALSQPGNHTHRIPGCQGKSRGSFLDPLPLPARHTFRTDPPVLDTLPGGIRHQYPASRRTLLLFANAPAPGPGRRHAALRAGVEVCG